jgi:hypothetical protein
MISDTGRQTDVEHVDDGAELEGEYFVQFVLPESEDTLTVALSRDMYERLTAVGAGSFVEIGGFAENTVDD